ncbi:hypothetical protein [Stenotrophomonas sp. MMGLT7]|uniref:hypothetical protein n=1 Tax=Stenotrophomonas sp. MMGLT7 TaxID=2901227 RepID=UPI001E5D78B8|nr:hypothetical protein [Stenotrophomonas sp. MMGLT7]MCD7097799.1 hypothetical protein [Stenotrophomonas sp. MMGLT7]
MKQVFREDVIPRVVALAVAAAILLLTWKVLVQRPDRSALHAADRMRLSFLERQAPPPGEREPPPVAGAQARSARASLPPLPDPAGSASPAAAAQPAPGRLRLELGALPSTAAAPGAAAGGAAAGEPGSQGRAGALLERPNPVEYRETVFDRKRPRGQSRKEQWLYGRDIQPAEARPPPDVAFDPSRHGRDADLGRESTGDAYKAAPIAWEPAPGLQGEASRRIRTATRELERRHARCDRALLQRLAGPVLVHLADLERVEAAMASGPDPVQAEHLLPRMADSAYDQARRALWHAEQELAACASRQ